MTPLPCPFCGQQPTVILSGLPPMPSVWCPGSECQGTTMAGKTYDDAIAAWNRRPVTASIAEAYRAGRLAMLGEVSEAWRQAFEAGAATANNLDAFVIGYMETRLRTLLTKENER